MRENFDAPEYQMFDTNEYQIRLLIQMLQETRKALPRQVDIWFLLKGQHLGCLQISVSLSVPGLSCKLNIHGLTDSGMQSSCPAT